MSYEKLKSAHDENMTRVRAQLRNDDPRESIISELRAQLTAAIQRAEAAEAALATLRRYANDGDKATARRIARIDELEAALAAVPRDEIKQLYIAAFVPTDPEKYDNYRRVAKWLFPDIEVLP